MRKYQAGGPVEGVKQDPALVTKAPKIKKEFGLIDWTKPAEYIERFVRAMQPWPTAYTFLHRPGKEPMRVIVNTSVHGRTRRCASDCRSVPTERLEVASSTGPTCLRIAV